MIGTEGRQREKKKKKKKKKNKKKKKKKKKNKAPGRKRRRWSFGGVKPWLCLGNENTKMPEKGGQHRKVAQNWGGGGGRPAGSNVTFGGGWQRKEKKDGETQKNVCSMV